MTLINTWEKLSSTTPIQPPLTQGDVAALQAMEARMTARMDASFAQAHRNLDTLSQSIDEAREEARSGQEAIFKWQSGGNPTLCQQIGDFIVTCCRSIGRLFAGRR